MATTPDYKASHLAEEPTTASVAETKPVETVQETVPVATETAPAQTNSSDFVADKCYTFTRATNVHTEPDANALVVGVRSVTETVTPEKIYDTNGYIWAEYHSSPKHVRYVALATSDGSEKFVK